jgi:putative MFS transporter
VGALLASIVIDRLPRHVTFAACAILMAGLGIGFASAEAPEVAMGFGMAYMVLTVIYAMTLSIYGPEMFVTQVRAFAAGLGYAANRIGAALVPLALLPLLLETGPLVLFGFIAIVLVLSAILVMLFGPRDVSGRALH